METVDIWIKCLVLRNARQQLRYCIVDAVKSKPLIYDLSHVNHKDQSKLVRALKDALDTMEISFSREDLARHHLSTVKELRDKFHYLRGNYRNMERKTRTPSGSGRDAETVPTWPWYWQM